MPNKICNQNYNYFDHVHRFKIEGIASFFFFFDEKCVIFHVIYQVIIMELSNLLREIKKNAFGVQFYSLFSYIRFEQHV